MGGNPFALTDGYTIKMPPRRVISLRCHAIAGYHVAVRFIDLKRDNEVGDISVANDETGVAKRG